MPRSLAFALAILAAATSLYLWRTDDPYPRHHELYRMPSTTDGSGALHPGQWFRS